MAEPRDYTKWNKSDKNKYHLYVEYKNDKNELTYKTEIDSDIENKLMIIKRKKVREGQVRNLGLSDKITMCKLDKQ